MLQDWSVEDFKKFCRSLKAANARKGTFTFVFVAFPDLADSLKQLQMIQDGLHVVDGMLEMAYFHTDVKELMKGMYLSYGSASL